MVAITERNKGESPKSAMLVPDATPMCLGKILDAANKEEKYLNRPGYCVCNLVELVETYAKTVPSPAQRNAKVNVLNIEVDWAGVGWSGVKYI